ncbi:MAG TPA: hypothetical protein VML75_27065 [Kofleriaceae bacterium]|nr:hypothetical protein [Kofleriaceae bacterium]
MGRIYCLLGLALALAACATSDGSATDDGGVPDGGDADSAVDDPDAGADASIADAPVADAEVADAALAPDAMADAMPAPDAMVDAMPPPDATPDACVPGWISLLTNGNFEQMTTGWTQSGTVIREYGAGYPWPTFDGTWGALLGGANNASHQLTQVVTVPASATALRLRGQRCFVTEETTTTIVYDTLTVQVQGGVIEQYVFSNLDAASTCGWSGFQLDAPSSHAGETITLSFAGSTDSASITSFGLDALFLEAFACP